MRKQEQLNYKGLNKKKSKLKKKRKGLNRKIKEFNMKNLFNSSKLIKNNKF